MDDMEYLTIAILAFVQSVSFSLVSRSRNRDNQTYHIIASTISNLIWFLTLRQLVLADMTVALLLPYMAGTVPGSVYGSRLSMKIERMIGATADGHLTKEQD